MSLYRKYRSQNFDELFGQDAISAVLKQSVKDKKWAHAYLLTGPRGTGKTSTARILAKAINCTDLEKNGNPCNKCESCIAITNGNYLDLIEIDAASNRGIEEIRSLKEKINFSPTQGKFKIYIIDEVHMLTNEAFNALLKTLEEPPSHIVFVLATTEPHKVLPTIISRCQRFDFKLASQKVIIDKLSNICKEEGFDYDINALEMIAKAAHGSFRDSETILEKVLNAIESKDRITIKTVEQILGLADTSEINRFVQFMLSGDLENSLEIFHGLYAQGINVYRFTDQVLEILRELLLKSYKNKEDSYSVRTLINAIKLIAEAQYQIKSATIDCLPIEVAIAEFTQTQSDNSIHSKLVQKNDNPENSPRVIKTLPEVNENKYKREEIERESTQEQDEKLLNFEDILSKWEEIIKHVKKMNYHLSAFLQKAEPCSIGKGNVLTLKVPFKFHKERIEQQKSKQMFKDITSEVVGTRVNLKCEVSERKNDDRIDSNKQFVEEIFGDLMT